MDANSGRIERCVLQWSMLIALLAAFAPWAHAAVTVALTTTPMAGFYHYDVEILNGEAVDLALVSILDAPLADPLIGPSLVVPGGFIGNYDGGLGIIDFLSDVDVFPAGQSTTGFAFDSLGATPDYFRSFGALGVNGEVFGDIVLIDNPPGRPVSGPGQTLLLAALGLAFLLRHGRRATRI